MINSIQQFAQEGVTKLSEIFVDYTSDLTKIAEMVYGVTEEVTGLGCRIIAEEWESYDNLLRERKELRKGWYIVRRDETSLITSLGEVVYHKTLFKNVETGESCYLLDQLMGIEHHARITEDAEARILKRNRELCKKIKQNDLDTETRLLLENEGLVRNLTSSLEMTKAMEDARYGGIELDDILQEGRIAMLRAAQNFDEDAGAEFSSYAYAAMKNAMTDLCRKGLSAFEKRMIDKGLTRVFLDANPVDKDGVALSEKISDGRHDPTGNLAVLHVMLEKMHNRLVLLPKRQQRLLAYHYGLGLLDCKTISETAAYFHLTEKYVEEIERGALKTLRDGMNDGKII